MQLNRAQRRSLNKKAKGKLTDNQYSDYMQKAYDDTVKIEVDRILNKTWDKIEECLNISMRENKISEERMKKIYSRMLELVNEKCGKEVNLR